VRELHLFAGAGGGLHAANLLGHTPVCAVEIEPYCRQVLRERQADGTFPPFPVFDDVKTFDGKPWRGIVDVVCGGFPCQPWSSAGKRKGTDDPRHLWPEMARVISEARPRYVFAENVNIKAFAEPWRDLRAMGYRVPPALCLSAEDVGAPHLRKRWWLLASDTNRDELRDEPRRRSGAGGQSEALASVDGEARQVPDTDGELPHGSGAQRATGRAKSTDACAAVPDADGEGEGEPAIPVDDEAPGVPGVGEVSDAGGARLEGHGQSPRGARAEDTAASDPRWWAVEPDVGRVAHGVANRVQRLKALGNGQVPQCAAEAWRILMAREAEYVLS